MLSSGRAPSATYSMLFASNSTISRCHIARLRIKHYTGAERLMVERLHEHSDPVYHQRGATAKSSVLCAAG